MKVYSYVIPRDYGFAPNPFHNYCTLATCKPKIRKAASVGDFIIGTNCSPNVDEIVFFMEVSEVLSFDEYWLDERFYVKRPNLFASKKYCYGDNIYHTTRDGGWLQEDSHHTHPNGTPVQENIDTDTSVNRVLVSENFSYWGNKPVKIPNALSDIVKTGPGHKCNFPDSIKTSVVDWLLGLERGLQGDPNGW